MAASDGVHHQVNCESVSIYCTCDSTCLGRCNTDIDTSLKHHKVYLCNNGHCEGVVLDQDYYELALEDYNIIVNNPKILRALPNNLLDIIIRNDGVRFIAGRAKFWGNFAKRLKLPTDDIFAEALNALSRWDVMHLKKKVDIMKQTKGRVAVMAGTKSRHEDSERDDEDNDGDHEIIDTTTTEYDAEELMLASISEKLGKTLRILEIGDPDIIHNKHPSTGKIMYGLSDNLVQFVNENRPLLQMRNTMNKWSKTRVPVVKDLRTYVKLLYGMEQEENLASLAYEEDNNEDKDTLARIVENLPKNPCNENMSAGILVGAVQGPLGKSLPICNCLYPEYLTGPMCQHRTYEGVINYDKWKTDGAPTFFTDPVHDQNAATVVCNSKTKNRVALWNPYNETFTCKPLAGHLRDSLQYRGPENPGKLVDTDYIDAHNNLQQKRGGLIINKHALSLTNFFEQ